MDSRDGFPTSSFSASSSVVGKTDLGTHRCSVLGFSEQAVSFWLCQDPALWTGDTMQSTGPINVLHLSLFHTHSWEIKSFNYTICRAFFKLFWPPALVHMFPGRAGDFFAHHFFSGGTRYWYASFSSMKRELVDLKTPQN